MGLAPFQQDTGRQAKCAGPAPRPDIMGWNRIWRRPSVLQRLWYDRRVRTQLLVAVGVTNLLAAVVAGAVAIFNTRVATKVEIEASLEVAQRFVAATMKDLAARDRLTPLNQELPLELKP